MEPVEACKAKRILRAALVDVFVDRAILLRAILYAANCARKPGHAAFSGRADRAAECLTVAEFARLPKAATQALSIGSLATSATSQSFTSVSRNRASLWKSDSGRTYRTTVTRFVGSTSFSNAS